MGISLTVYLAHIILSLPVGLYHIKIGSPGEPAATTMSQTGCYMDVKFPHVPLAENVQLHELVLSNRLHIYTERQNTEDN